MNESQIPLTVTRLRSPAPGEVTVHDVTAASLGAQVSVQVVGSKVRLKEGPGPSEVATVRLGGAQV